jgi:hypothetical protein
MFAQQEYEFRQVDSITFNAYLTGDWDKVLRTGKQAVKNEIDYYYLRQRMGIAYFSKGNYRAASRQFEAAANYNPGNAVTRNYLYYSLLYSGQYPEAYYSAVSLNENMRKISDIPKQGVVRALYLETGPEFSNNFDDNALGKLPKEQYLQYQDMYGNSYYTNLGIVMQIFPRMNLYAAYSNLIIEKKTMMQYAWNSPDSTVQEEWGFSKYFPARPKIETGDYEYSLHQNSAYLRPGIILGKGWSIVPAIHYIHFNTKKVVIRDNSRRIQDTAYYVASTDFVSFFQYDRTDLQLAAVDIYDDLFVISLGISKRVSVFDLSMLGSWSNLYGRSQFQYGINLAYYPLGNLRLYGNTNIKGFTEDSDTRVVYSQMVGGKLLGFLWAEAFGTFGNLKGTNESDAFVVYNITDDIDLKTGLNLIFVLSPAVSITLRYQYLQKTGFRYTYGQGSNPGEKIQDLEYINQSIIGGLKWIF